MAKHIRRAIQSLLLVLVASLALGAPSPALASGHTVTKIAIGGEVAPDTGGALHDNSFFSVVLNQAGEVAFANGLTGGVPGWGVFLYGPGGSAALSLEGDTAPDTGGGSYFLPGGFTSVNDDGEVSFMAVALGGSATSGIFLDSGGGADLAVVVAGQPAPDTGGGAFDGALNALNFHSLNAGGDVAFTDTVTGGTIGSGVFRYSGGAHTSVSLEGDSAPGTGGGVYDGFESPAMNDAGDVVFPALVAGGSGATRGLFRDSGGVDSVLGLEGDPAPDTGGGSFVDFVFPDQNADGDVAFLSDVTGGTAIGGVFQIVGGAVNAVAVDGGTAPGTGGGTYATITSFAPINQAGDVAFSATLTDGSVDAGVFLFDASAGQVVPVVLFGETAPDSGGATFAQFGFVDINDAGQIALQATLSDATLGLFLVSPPPPAVPTLPAGGLIVLAAALLGTAWSFGRRPCS
jgi:hypothetical protein